MRQLLKHQKCSPKVTRLLWILNKFGRNKIKKVTVNSIHKTSTVFLWNLEIYVHVRWMGNRLSFIKRKRTVTDSKVIAIVWRGKFSIRYATKDRARLITRCLICVMRQLYSIPASSDCYWYICGWIKQLMNYNKMRLTLLIICLGFILREADSTIFKRKARIHY